MAAPDPLQHLSVEEQLFHALFRGNPGEFQGQLDRIEDIDVKNGSGRTLLHIAVRLGRLSWVKALLTKGSDPSILDRNGSTVVEVAREMAIKFPEDGIREDILEFLRILSEWESARKVIALRAASRLGSCDDQQRNEESAKLAGVQGSPNLEKLSTNGSEENSVGGLPQENWDTMRAWISGAAERGLDSVANTWEKLMKPRLGRREDLREFLRWKFDGGGSLLSAALRNQGDAYVVFFVWDLLRSTFHPRELEGFLLEAEGEIENTRLLSDRRAFSAWAIGLLKREFVDHDGKVRVGLGRDAWGRRHLLMDFHPFLPLPPWQFSTLQRISLYRRIASLDLSVRMRNHYAGLYESCLGSSWWIGIDRGFEAGVEEDFRSIGLSSLPWPFRSGFRGLGNLSGVRNRAGETVQELQLKTFAVLLKRQLVMEEMLLGRVEMVERLKGEWPKMFSFFSLLETEGDSEWTSEPLVLLTFAVLSGVLAREEVAEVLLDTTRRNALEMALYRGDSRAFYAMYDVARWAAGELALWWVHAHGGSAERTPNDEESLHRRRANDTRTVLQVLLEEQEVREMKIRDQKEKSLESHAKMKLRKR